jgi:Ca2+-binding RTX toxin-like protein
MGMTSRKRIRLRRGLAVFGMAAAVSPVLLSTGSAAPVGQGFTVTPSDLSHILRQIKIAEHHVAATTIATGPCGALVGNGPDQIGSPLVAEGLRTVDGSCNNLISGQDRFGASGENFPRITPPVFKEADAPPPAFGPFGPLSAGGNTQYKGTGNVVDSQPRLISNLIVDQTSTNPAAVAAARHPVRSQSTDPPTCAAVNETQSIMGTPTGDFTVEYNGNTTPLLAATISRADLDAALDLVVGGAGVNVVGGLLPKRFVVTFNGVAGDKDALIVSDADLKVSTLTQGVAQGMNCAPAHSTLFIENVTTDVGLSPPFNSLFTIFGQFFDHGVDKTSKPGATVFVPLKSDDPLVAGPDHVLGTSDDLSPGLRFMPLSRAAKDPDGPDNDITTLADNDSESKNTDTPFVDQSQTYTSHPSHQAFLRDYVAGSAGPDNILGDPNPALPDTSLDDLPLAPRATGGLISGVTNGGQANWTEVKLQAAQRLGLQLIDRDVLAVPMIATDVYGNFIPGPNGFPQWMTETGLVEGDPAANGGLGVPAPANVKHFSIAFLDDIAHSAAPDQCDSNGDHIPDFNKVPDDNSTAGNSLDTPVAAGVVPGCAYDDELLGLHFIAGDGRLNENIALTAVHQIFHSEHNRLTAQMDAIIAADPTLNATYHATGANTFTYGERLFQAARFVTEMEYQHLVFEEFGRKVQPLINPFAGFAFTQTNINPAVKAEFAHAVYRFGHSMLTQDIKRINTDGSTNDIGLLEGFLNPAEYNRNYPDAETAGGAIMMGLSDDAGNEIDEFVTDTLRNNLLGLPLDLPAINMTRARSEGVPPLNQFRKQVYGETSDSQLKPYTDWVDFGNNLKHPESLVNFVAAYGTHPSIVGETTIAGKREAARLIVTPDLTNGDVPPVDASDFLNSIGSWADVSGHSATGLDDVDLWVGGLAERTNVFGGLLGSTFNYVFENQMTDLQNSDRLYYLGRTPGMNLRSQLEGNSFAELVMRNTTAHSLKADAFATADCKFELSNLPASNSPFTGNLLVDDPAPASACDESHVLIRLADGTIAYREYNQDDPPGINGQSVFNGRDTVDGPNTNADRIRGGNDADTFRGNGGNDVIEGGDGGDFALGGEGDDRITDIAGDDFHKGGPGNDAIDGGPGLDILLGGDGKDFLNGGGNFNDSFGGPGDDFMILGQGEDVGQGDSGSDWMQGGDQPDLLQGDSGALFFNDPNKPGHDIFIGQAGDDDYDAEGGDDIMVADAGIEKNAGAAGFDFSTGAKDPLPQDADLERKILAPDVPITTVDVRDRFNEVEALSGGPLNDLLKGDSLVPRDLGGVGTVGCDALDQASLDRISGLDPLVPALTPQGNIVTNAQTHDCSLVGNIWGDGNILLGGAGSDTIEGRGANDIIDGDKYLDVRLSIRTDPTDPGSEIGTTDLLERTYQVGNTHTLQHDIMAGVINPGNIVAVREILTPNANLGVDRAVFSDVRSNYTIVTNGDTTTVAHLGGTGADGTDTIRNIELLQFSDITIGIGGAAGGGSTGPATGTPAITGIVGTLRVGNTLTATNGSLADPDGVLLVTFAWEMQQGATWVQVGTGPSFTPGLGQLNRSIRVVAQVLDNVGSLTTNLISTPTAPVEPALAVPGNVAATGVPVIFDRTGLPITARPKIGDPLTADTSGIADLNGLVGVVFHFQWQRSAGGVIFTDIAGATEQSFTPAANNLGDLIRVRVFFTDQGGAFESVLSAPTRDVRPARTRVAIALALTRAAVPVTIAQETVAARGVSVGVTAPATTRVLRIRVFQGKAKAAAVTVFINVKAGKTNVKLRQAAIKRVLKRGGAFRIEMTPGTSKTDLGTPTVRRINVHRAPTGK